MNEGDRTNRPVHIAVVGSGPSGFYASEALLRSGVPVRVDMFERLPTPFGLVRSGVAPDHPKLKEAILVYDRIARTEGFSFLGNVTVGRDVSIAEMQNTYHAIVFACGAQSDRKMGIPGEDLANCHTATEFVGWYNGHPDYRDRMFDLSQEVAVIVGQGNVAADVCRILAKPVDELRNTDIADYALEALAHSNVRQIYVIGRRGPAQAKFTTRELRELGVIPGCIALADPAECTLNAQSELEIVDRANVNGVKNTELIRSFASHDAIQAQRQIHFRFCLSPATLSGKSHVEKMVLVRNRLEGPRFAQIAQPTAESIVLDCGLVFRSIGYRGVPIPGLPFDQLRGILPNTAGRIVDGSSALPGLYVTGWLKRGPNGIIGTNRADSGETVESLLADLPTLSDGAKAGIQGVLPLLKTRGVQVVSLRDWLRIDAAEIERGRTKGKPREKFTRVQDMLRLVS